LKLNIDVNHLSDVQVHKLALSDRSGESNLFHDRSQHGGLTMSVYRERIKDALSSAIETTTLSKYVDRTVDYLKMDIEGSKAAVLQELNHSKKLSLIQEMAIEYHHHIVKDVDCLSSLFHILEQNHFGYQVRSSLRHPQSRGQFQDIMIYAYKK
jgi:FkbM family methyltransferase